MRIVLDEARCSSLGLCEQVAPDVFEVADDGELLIARPEQPESRRVLLQQAVAACPTAALSLED